VVDLEVGASIFGSGAGESELNSTNGISEKRKTNSSSDSFVIFFLQGPLYKKGVVLFLNLIYLPFEKKELIQTRPKT